MVNISRQMFNSFIMSWTSYQQLCTDVSMLLHHLAPKVYGFTPWFVHINFRQGLPLPTELLGTASAILGSQSHDEQWDHCHVLTKTHHVFTHDVIGDVIKIPAHAQHMTSCNHCMKMASLKYQLIYKKYHVIFNIYQLIFNKYHLIFIYINWYMINITRCLHILTYV